MLGGRGTEVGRLLHAYGPASDTPSHLHALTGDDWEAQLKALDHLAYSVVHQYSVYPVTPSAVRVVAGLLDHSALRRTVDDKPPLLAEVLDFFDEVAYSVSAAGATATTELLWEEVETTPEDVAGYFETLANHDIDLPASPPLDQLWELSIADLHAALAELVDVILPLSKDHDPTVRTRSICLLTRLAGVSTVNPRAQELASYFSSRVDATKSRDERAALVVGVGEVGGDTSAWLRDADEPIRACAAVYLPGDPAATSVLQAALSSPTAISDWFTEQPWRHSGVSETLLRDLVSRNLVFADILPVALAIAKTAAPWFPDGDWGLLLLHAFPGVEFQSGVQPLPPTSLDESQRAYLEALVENDALWDPLNGTCRLARMRADVPQQRDDMIELLRDLA